LFLIDIYEILWENFLREMLKWNIFFWSFYPVTDLLRETYAFYDFVYMILARHLLLKIQITLFQSALFFSILISLFFVFIKTLDFFLKINWNWRTIIKKKKKKIKYFDDTRNSAKGCSYTPISCFESILSYIHFCMQMIHVDKDNIWQLVFY